MLFLLCRCTVPILRGKNLIFLKNSRKVSRRSGEPEKGKELIEDYNPDVVFLDINMPGLDGFTQHQNLDYKNFKLAFTTSYRDFDIKAIKQKAVGYLVKPIDVDELKICVDNILEDFDTKPTSTRNAYNQVIELSVKNGIIFIKPREIVRPEAERSYMVFHTTNKIKYVASKNLKEHESILDPDIFSGVIPRTR